MVLGWNMEPMGSLVGGKQRHHSTIPAPLSVLYYLYFCVCYRFLTLRVKSKYIWQSLCNFLPTGQ